MLPGHDGNGDWVSNVIAMAQPLKQIYKKKIKKITKSKNKTKTDTDTATLVVFKKSRTTTTTTTTFLFILTVKKVTTSKDLSTCYL